MLKSVIAGAIALATLGNIAQAETWTLHKHKRWVVEYNSSNDAGLPMCMAKIDYPRQAFWIKATAYDYWYGIYDGNKRWREQEGVLDFWVDNGDYVVMDGWAKGSLAQAYPDSLDHDAAEFLLREIYRGRKLYIDFDGDNYSDYGIDLSGSAAAINALIDCKNKL